MMNPEDDGKTHVNVYSKGRTKLGRALSHFAHIPLEHPLYGRFSSMEAYWYWLKTGKQHEHLRELYGFEAKKQGKLLEAVLYDDFDAEIRQGNRLKLYQTTELLGALVRCRKPLVHYYSYHGKVVPAKGFDLVGCLQDIAEDFK